MPGKPAAGLLDDGSLIGFLQSTLEAMEAAAGGQLGEERAKLQELQLALGRLGVASSKPAETDDLALASQLDQLEEQLQAVEKQIASADEDTKELLTSSTAVWAGGKSAAAHGTPSLTAAQSSEAPGSLNGDSAAGPEANEAAGFNGHAAASGGPASALAALAPVTEAAEEAAVEDSGQQ